MLYDFAGLPSFTPVIYPNPATLESSSEEEDDEPPLTNRNTAYYTSRSDIIFLTVLVEHARLYFNLQIIFYY